MRSPIAEVFGLTIGFGGGIFEADEGVLIPAYDMQGQGRRSGWVGGKTEIGMAKVPRKHALVSYHRKGRVR